MIIDARALVTNPNGIKPHDPALVVGLAVHHTVTDPNGPATPDFTASEAEERAHIRAIDLYHVSIGYGGFAYHGAAFASGRAYFCGEGQRAHVAGRNHQLRGYAYVGTFTTLPPTEGADNAMRELLQADRDRFGALPIKGHREWALPGEGTACPGVVVPRDWASFMAPTPPARDWIYGTEAAGCERRGNQLFYWHRGVEVDAVGDYEGIHVGAHYHREGPDIDGVQQWRQVLP